MYGNPENPLRYTSKSCRNIRNELNARGYRVSYVTVSRLLKKLGYSLQKNKKLIQVGESHPDRDEQFKTIETFSNNTKSKNQPIISIDSKKKEKIGNFAANGSELAKKGQAVTVLDHDFAKPSEELPTEMANIYGVYDVNNNNGFVNIGTSNDTAEFAVNTIGMWLENYDILHITADGGGSNGRSNKLFKMSLQSLADKHNIGILVTHLPPGTSKWNKIEHSLFSYISMNMRGKPLYTIDTLENIIANTRTSKGLTVSTHIDTNNYEKGIKFTDEELSKLNIYAFEFHGEWNYFVCPTEKSIESYNNIFGNLTVKFDKILLKNRSLKKRVVYKKNI